MLGEMQKKKKTKGIDLNGNIENGNNEE